MKSMLTVLLIAISIPAFAEDDVVAVSSVVPAVRSITKTTYGYYLDTSYGRKYAYKTSYGYRIDGGPSLYRNSTGFSVQDPLARARLTSKR